MNDLGRPDYQKFSCACPAPTSKTQWPFGDSQTEPFDATLGAVWPRGLSSWLLTRSATTIRTISRCRSDRLVS